MSSPVLPKRSDSKTNHEHMLQKGGGGPPISSLHFNIKSHLLFSTEYQPLPFISEPIITISWFLSKSDILPKATKGSMQAESANQSAPYIKMLKL